MFTRTRACNRRANHRKAGRRRARARARVKSDGGQHETTGQRRTYVGKPPPMACYRSGQRPAAVRRVRPRTPAPSWPIWYGGHGMRLQSIVRRRRVSVSVHPSEGQIVPSVSPVRPAQKTSPARFVRPGDKWRARNPNVSTGVSGVSTGENWSLPWCRLD